MRYGTLSIGAPEMAVNTAATAWQQKGPLSIDRRANQKWREILKAYQEPQLPAETDEALRRNIESKYGA
jgi:trimethylamine:corrinoid methyltransferase-like protein